MSATDLDPLRAESAFSQKEERKANRVFTCALLGGILFLLGALIALAFQPMVNGDSGAKIYLTCDKTATVLYSIGVVAFFCGSLWWLHLCVRLHLYTNWKDNRDLTWRIVLGAFFICTLILGVFVAAEL